MLHTLRLFNRNGCSGLYGRDLINTAGCCAYPVSATRPLKDGAAIAIDGEIFQDAGLEPIPAEAEVHVIL